MSTVYATIAESRLQASILNTTILLVIAYPLLLDINRRLLSGASKYTISFESCLLGFLIWFGPILAWMNSPYVSNHPGLEYGIFLTAIGAGLIYGRAIVRLHSEGFLISREFAERGWVIAADGILLLFSAFYLAHIPLILVSMIFASPATTSYPW